MRLPERIERWLYTVATLSPKKIATRLGTPLCATQVLRPSIQRVARKRAASGDLPAWKQTAEMLRLALRDGLEPELYVRARLSRPKLTWEQKRAFVGTQPYLRAMNSVNPPPYRELANKYTSAVLFRAFGVPAPESYACLGPGGVTFDGQPMVRPADLERLVRERSITSACIKLVHGFGGDGFARVDFKGEDDHPCCVIGGESLSLDAFWDRLHLATGPPRLLQALVEQHPELTELHPESVNTARVLMVREHSGKWRMLDATLRMGAGGGKLDNLSQGGCAARIDLDTGVLGVAWSPDPQSPKDLEFLRHETHPTTGARIRGRALPMWSEMPEFCDCMCRPFAPGLRLLGLDVAFGRTSPLAIEVNPRGDTAWFQAITDRGYREVVERTLREARRQQ